MKRQQLITLLGLVLIFVSLLIITIGIRVKQNNLVATPSVSAATPIQLSSSAVSGSPKELIISSLNMDLPIIDGYYDSQSGKWTLTKDKVQFAVISPAPNNESGNTFLYGHYRKQVFARLHTIKAGSEAIIVTDNGHRFVYQLEAVNVVKPNESADVFNYRGTPKLTIQTCTGLFYQDRQLFVFKFLRVE